jgi:hypothetical protein
MTELKHTKQMPCKGGSGAKLLLFLLSSWIGMAGIGCGNTKFTASAPPASVLQTPVSDADKQQAEQVVREFVADAQQSNFRAMEPMMSVSLRKTQSLTESIWGVSGEYHALIESHDWAFDLVEARNNGSKIIVHAHFTGSDAGNYRTNFVLLKHDGGWTIDMVLVPSKAVHPVSGASGSQAPSK